MTKGRILDFRNSQLYYRKFGIDPDKHFDMLCEKYGGDVANDIFDRNCIRMWEDGIRKEKEREEREQRELEAECPFG